MLKQILREIENTPGSITISELSRKLKVEPNALEGMLQFWVRKGRIRLNESSSTGENDHGRCGPTCNGTPDCAFTVNLPKTYSIPRSPNAAPWKKISEE